MRVAVCSRTIFVGVMVLPDQVKVEQDAQCEHADAFGAGKGDKAVCHGSTLPQHGDGVPSASKGM